MQKPPEYIVEYNTIFLRLVYEPCSCETAKTPKLFRKLNLFSYPKSYINHVEGEGLRGGKAKKVEMASKVLCAFPYKLINTIYV